MASWNHPELGAIVQMPSNASPKKVWKHFYNPAERWERLCNSDVALLRREAECAVGQEWETGAELPQMSTPAWRSAKRLLLEHHERLYGVAYWEDMRSLSAEWAPHATRDGYCVLGPRSVFLVISPDLPRQVITAFRPRPPTAGFQWSEAHFRRHGKKYFRRETSPSMRRMVEAAVDELTQSSSTPKDAQELWWLVSAIGYGRLLCVHPEVQAALPAAERALVEVDDSIRTQLRAALDWSGCYAELMSGLREYQPEELEAALVLIEELLVVASALGEGASAVAFHEKVAIALAASPSKVASLGVVADARLRTFMGSAEPVVAFWQTVKGLAEGQAAQRSTNRSWFHWRDRISEWAADSSGQVGRWVQSCLDRLDVRAPVPMMGRVDSESQWEVHGHPAPGAPRHYRVFVVDSDNPDGYEVTGQFNGDNGDLWRIDREDDGALIILIASDQELAGDLDSLLSDAAHQEDVAVQMRLLQPTQQTKAIR